MTKPHNPNCAIVRQGNTRAWCDCGVDNQTPPDWVLIEAAVADIARAALGDKQ